jgi:predicted GNAT family N-acyltransferase
MEILRVTETWQRAGAWYVRIQAMAKKHHITLPQEFDEHDGPETRYILVTEEDFPIATARMYPEAPGKMMIGRVVVLPEYRHRGIGGKLLQHAAETAKEHHCRVMNLSIVEENTVLRKWYERYGAVHTGTEKYDFFPFTCGYMKICLL